MVPMDMATKHDHKADEERDARTKDDAAENITHVTVQAHDMLRLIFRTA